MDAIKPSSDPQQINVQIYLAGGSRHTVELPSDSLILHDLFAALKTYSQPLNFNVPTFFQIPVREGRAALSFSREHLVNVVTEPCALVQPSQSHVENRQNERPLSELGNFAHDANPNDTAVNNMEIVKIDNEAFYLFLDIFVHGSGRKITAVAAYYHEDIDWQCHGVDYEQVVLSFGSHETLGTYIPHRLDSWEPSIILDFEHPALEAYIRENAWITFTIKAGPHEKTFRVSTKRPLAYDTAMSVIIRDENRWITHYLDYYLRCMQVQHVFVYDNYTRDKSTLRQLLAPYLEQGQVTYIPWHYRWKNRQVPKQIGQPPQQVHSLNKYANSRWIGVFDVDEFLRIPGQTIPEFLHQFDADAIGGVSFGLRWFMYKGEADYDDIENPLLSFLHAKRDSLGRKRQKLFVSPRNVRFMRFHWIQEDATETQIDDTDIFFHHYYLRKFRFDEGKTESDTVYDDYMVRFSHLLAPVSLTDRGVSNLTPSAKLQTADEWIAHVEASFEKAEQSTSRLSEEILSMEGMCGTFTRHFYNNVCNFEGCRFIEIGSWTGASLCSAMFRNHLSAVSIDNWSQFGGPKQIFLENVSKYKGHCELSIIEQDCFAVDMNELGSCNVFLYDGHHSKESQYKALMQYYGHFENYAIVIIDDWNWKDVREGTKEAMKDLEISVLFEKEIFLNEDDVKDMPRHKGRHTWWNGIYVMVICKSQLS